MDNGNTQKQKAKLNNTFSPMMMSALYILFSVSVDMTRLIISSFEYNKLENELFLYIDIVKNSFFNDFSIRHTVRKHVLEKSFPTTFTIKKSKKQ